VYKVLGTRRSLLATTQTELVRNTLCNRWRDLTCDTVTIVTSGDEDRFKSGQPLPLAGVKGLFTAELEEALFIGRIDLAIHCLKDMPAICNPKFVVLPVMGRDWPFDVLITRSQAVLALEDMPTGMVVGTTSLRRVAQLRAIRPDFRFMEIRGNVDSRLRKLDSGEVDAIILAEAGLRRLGLTEKRPFIRFSLAEMVPAPGQGVLAAQCRADDIDTQSLISFLVDNCVASAVAAEQSFITGIGATCQTPVGAYAEVSNGIVTLTIRCSAADGSDRAINLCQSGSQADAIRIGANLAEEAISAGALKLLGLSDSKRR
jgi:hydroxymethylbilane synthase